MLMAMSGMQEFGALIKRAREQRGLTGVELADAIGRPHSFVVRLERGQNANPPDPRDFDAIASALGLSKQTMLQELGYLDPPDAPVTDTITLAVTDPRARVVAALDGLPDDAVNQWVIAIEALSAATRLNASRGIKSPDTDRDKPHTA